MNQALIKTLLESSLPLRLALLDADPTGWIVRSLSLNTVHTLTALDTDAQTLVRVAVKLGAAFLPCNPLAIVRHAVRLASTNPLFRYRPRTWDMDNGRVAACIHIVNQDGKEIAGIGVDGANDYECAVALLREVVG